MLTAIHIEKRGHVLRKMVTNEGVAYTNAPSRGGLYTNRIIQEKLHSYWFYEAQLLFLKKFRKKLFVKL